MLVVVVMLGVLVFVVVIIVMGVGVGVVGDVVWWCLELVLGGCGVDSLCWW